MTDNDKYTMTATFIKKKAIETKERIISEVA